MRPLYEINNDLMNLSDAIEQAKTPEQQAELIDAYLAAEGDFEEKFDRYAGLIKCLEGMAELRKKEADRMKKMQKVDENKARRLRERLLFFMKAQDRPELNTERFRFKVVTNGGKQKLTLLKPLEEIPARFKVQELVEKVDDEAVRTAISDGELVEWAKLESKTERVDIR